MRPERIDLISLDRIDERVGAYPKTGSLGSVGSWEKVEIKFGYLGFTKHVLVSSEPLPGYYYYSDFMVVVK